jgi:hypothetical protein
MGQVSAVSVEPKKGYYEVNRDHLTVYVKRGYVLIPCYGAAHQPGGGHIDNCGVCLNGPWGWVAKKG